MKPSSVREKSSRVAARNATLMNLLGTPGLGSLMAGRRVAGAGQLVLAVAGFTLVAIWFVKQMTQFYGQISGSVPVQPVGWIGLLGGGIFALAWVWSLVTSLSLMRQAAAANAKAPIIFPGGKIKPDEAKFETELAALPQWQRAGEIISRTFVFKDFPAAMQFVNAVAEIAEAAQHHPDVDIRWNKVTLALTTHDAGGLTEKDFALARQCDALADR
jgi:4a-hydroxytetrahydrobiopterin dehydratase